jgi:dTDP-4-dehydrorhamnose 3,5-epimerase
MDIKHFEIEGPIEIVAPRFGDDRGFFSETFNLSRLQAAGVNVPAWIQDNQSFSEHAYTLRGLHFQSAPAAQAKLVRVLKGSIFDVAVDLRKNSSSFGKWIGTTLTAAKMNQLYVPEGFAHGFVTLEPKVEVFYKVSSFYSKAHDCSVLWNDCAFGIEWPVPVGAKPHLSAKDETAPSLSEIVNQLS